MRSIPRPSRQGADPGGREASENVRKFRHFIETRVRQFVEHRHRQMGRPPGEGFSPARLLLMETICFKGKHNHRLAEGLDVEAVYYAERSLHQTVEMLTNCAPLVRALALTRPE